MPSADRIGSHSDQRSPVRSLADYAPRKAVAAGAGYSSRFPKKHIPKMTETMTEQVIEPIAPNPIPLMIVALQNLDAAVSMALEAQPKPAIDPNELNTSIESIALVAVQDGHEAIATDALEILVDELENHGLPRFAVARGVIEGLPKLLSKGDEPWVTEAINSLIDAI
jgi:hypothetical protein